MAAFRGIAENHTGGQGHQILAGLTSRQHTRADLLRMLFVALGEQGIRYCVLHSYEGLPEELPSDLDLAVHPDDAGKLPRVFATLHERGYRSVQCINYAVRGYCFIFFWLEGREPKSVAIDVIFEHREGGLILLPAAELIASRRRQGLFWKPDPKVEFEYLLSKKTLKGNLPNRQAERLKLLVGEIGGPLAQAVAGKLFGKKYEAPVVEACIGGYLDTLLRQLRLQLWRKTLALNPLNPVKNLLADLLRRFRRWMRPTGISIVVLGPDGIGKSTLIEHLARAVGPGFRRSRGFHWRPGLLWRKPQSGLVLDPHGRPPYATWWSVPRLFAHLMDYWLGYWLIVRPLLVRSGLVLFDRYYHDMLVDPKRYRYGGPHWLARALRSFIPAPDLVMILDAPENVIRSRKREVAPEEVTRQRHEYLQLAMEWPCVRVLDASHPAREVGAEAARVVLDHLQRRFQSRHAFWLGSDQTRARLAVLDRPVEVASRKEAFERALDRSVKCAPPQALLVQQSRPPLTTPVVAHLVWGAQCKREARQLTQQGYTRTQCFALLPSRKEPRWLLPLGSAEMTIKGLEIYAPYAPAARVLGGLLKGLIKSGWQGWARDRVLIASKEPLAVERFVWKVTGEERPVFALSLGTPGHCTKLTIQVMRSGGEILGYLKLPLTAAATERVRHEAEVLRHLWSFEPLRSHIPEVLYAGEWEGDYILFQLGGASRPGPVQFGSAQQEFLETLWSVQRSEKRGHVLTEEVAARWQATEPLLDSRWRAWGRIALDKARQEFDGALIPCAISHGDFAPWNTRVKGERLFVFDWESADEQAPASWDIYHFHTQTACLLHRKNGRDRPALANPVERATYLLYLLRSACQCLAEHSERAHHALNYRLRLLATQLSKP
ncbi:MAG: hypothetical protein HY237_05030 [Acidobacteria bacterium]|nr:hypothetical protein [Acidobacteriota bacterium]